MNEPWMTMDRTSEARPVAGRGHAGDAIRPIACDGAAFTVTIDGKPYAGFVNRAYAEMAVDLWSGRIDGIGNAIPERERGAHGWPAVRGHRLEVVAGGEYNYRAG